ncbi:epoxide hydrolase family protein [Geodermatophilus nigrescens]|uniref:Pimeloyl-ACP methyl ester carboxylesterase n=1 Tax=Geodermatophilus nigrescens TaxID=1070870 RepID=A0A1M5FPD5_9ACTN|nr:epoxide hydrolase [Geodermatophilus nigrescens]SHF93417.1 Pimeloyl-ACP methyl ester carboxylesterase [Geodermatophilus nigrescens]
MQPFQLDISAADIEDLRDRLARTRWPEQLPGDTGWAKGVPVAEARAWARDLAAFDWRALQDELNALPQFTTEIDGATVHLVHARSARADAVPLLVLHGWPGTVVELVDLVEPLTSPESDDDPAFSVVIPSHPGVGLSGRTAEPGWGVPRTARAYAELMARLGYGSYVVQGGDHGAVLAPQVGRVDPAHVRGVHVNAATVGFIPMGEVDEETAAGLSPLEQRRLARIAEFMTDGNGYTVIQATRPQTIGYGLEDSPAALLTWIVEKVEAWTHDPARLGDRHYRDRHLADVLVYWLTRTATSAADVVYASYGDLFADPLAFADSGVPTAVLAYAEDVAIRRFAEQGNTIVRWTDVDDGGHFAALEQPASLVADLRAFVRGLGPVRRD